MTSLARKANHNSHFQTRPAVVDCDHAATVGNFLQRESSSCSHAPSSLFQGGTGYARLGRAPHCASDSLVQSRDCMRSIRTILRSLSSSFVAFVLRRVGAFRCMEHCKSAWLVREKSTDRMEPLPTNWSKAFFLKLHQHFGRPTPLHISPRRSAARCGRSSDILADSAIGPAMRSARSSLKFSSVMECATSA